MADSQEKQSTQGTQQQQGMGIPSVAGAKKKPANVIFIVLAVVALVAAIAFGYWQKHHKAEAEAPSKDNGRLFSGQVLTVPPIAQVEPPEVPVTTVPAIEKNAEPEPVVEPVVPLGQNPTLTQMAPLAPSEPPPPTLEEKRNMAKMMGEAATITDSLEDGGKKGLATSLQEEMGNPSSGGKLGGNLRATATPKAKASHMGSRNLLIAKGTFIDCVLETKVDTTVPGMTSCVLPRDIYSANGKVVLLEKGSKAIGEYTGAVENGLNRIFVLWTQIQTPKGVRIALDSPATDSLGGAGLGGEVDFHWWQRFGNALLFSLVQDGFEFGMNKQTDSAGGVNYFGNSNDGMQEIIQEAMRQSGNIPPTLRKNQGEKIGIFVGRDLDFSSVYQLRPKQLKVEPLPIATEQEKRETVTKTRPRSVKNK